MGSAPGKTGGTGILNWAIDRWDVRKAVGSRSNQGDTTATTTTANSKMPRTRVKLPPMGPIISRDDQAVNGNRIRRGLIESVSKFTHMVDFGGHRRMHKTVRGFASRRSSAASEPRLRREAADASVRLAWPFVHSMRAGIGSKENNHRRKVTPNNDRNQRSGSVE